MTSFGNRLKIGRLDVFCQRRKVGRIMAYNPKLKVIKGLFVFVIGILICVGSIRMMGSADEMGRSDTLGMMLITLGIIVYIAMRIYLKKMK